MIFLTIINSNKLITPTLLNRLNTDMIHIHTITGNNSYTNLTHYLYFIAPKNNKSSINISMPCVDNKDLIYNIKELPETFSIAAGDMLVIETDEGTNIMDFNNFVIGLDNTTFGTTITQHSTDIASLSSEIDSLSATEVED